MQKSTHKNRKVREIYENTMDSHKMEHFKCSSTIDIFSAWKLTNKFPINYKNAQTPLQLLKFFRTNEFYYF